MFAAVTLAILVLPRMEAMIVALAAGGIALVLSHLYREAIACPYVATVVRMEGLAAGDLTADYPEAYAALKTSFNAALANLRDLLGSVTSSTANIRVGSQEIAMASEDLARRTEGNAASLERTVAAVQETDIRLKATAQAASRSVDTQAQAMVAVTEGRARTDVAVQAMHRVSACARGIDDMIEGLDKIAFQMRVLAMNATLAAGRAGDAALASLAANPADHGDWSNF